MGKTKPNQKTERTSGITLIALVITIIVLLILAAVSISTLTGENGILARANEAREKSDQSQNEENDAISKFEDLIDDSLNSNPAPKVEDTTPGVLDGNGTEDEPFEISSIEDLVAFSKQVNGGNNYSGKHIKLMVSLDFKSDNSYVDPNNQDFEDVNQDGQKEGLKQELLSGQGFTPIGNYNAAPYPFSGTFDGNKNYIKNLYINIVKNDGESDTGLFGYIKTPGLVKQVYVLNCNIYTEDQMVISGGICGTADGKIENCATTGKVEGVTTGTKYRIVTVGGIAGNLSIEDNEALINECYNASEVLSGEKEKEEDENNDMKWAVGTGGIAGGCNAKGQVISNCYNKGHVLAKTKSNYYSVGGIIGKIGEEANSGVLGNPIEYQTGGKIENCYNVGLVEAINEFPSLITFDRYLAKGSAIGKIGLNSTITNVYGIGSEDLPIYGYQEKTTDEEKQSVITNLELKTNSEMKSKEFLSSLGAKFKEDTGINGGYPILEWQ